MPHLAGHAGAKYERALREILRSDSTRVRQRLARIAYKSQRYIGPEPTGPVQFHVGLYLTIREQIVPARREDREGPHRGAEAFHRGPQRIDAFLRLRHHRLIATPLGQREPADGGGVIVHHVVHAGHF